MQKRTEVMKKALIAMSGGVDSSVAAYLMKKDGYSCVGITMKLYDNDMVDPCSEKTCCSLKDVEDAREVAFNLDIPYYVVNFKDKFEEKVINKFIEAYKNGATPNPCIDCNRYLKFDKLVGKMRDLELDYVVTGHYARIEKDGGRFLLKKGIDPLKDQSYVLYTLTKDQLKITRLPLGGYTKAVIREIAAENGFLNAKKKDSQDICFVPDGDYASFIENHTHQKFPKGDFVTQDGKKLGTHNGIIRYTIGQRKGLGLALNQPMYVKGCNVSENQVILCTNDELFSKELDANDINLTAVDRIDTPLNLSAKIRYKHKEAPCRVWQTGDDSIHVEFTEPQRAITKGQAVVLYDGDTVIGGGTIL